MPAQPEQALEDEQAGPDGWEPGLTPLQQEHAEEEGEATPAFP